MSHSFFTDKTLPLSIELVESELRASLPQWQGLVAFIRTKIQTTEALRFLYGKDYGWALRFQRGGKLLCALFPNKGYFVTLLIMNQVQLKQIESVRVTKNIQSALGKADFYREGKWLFIQSESEKDIKGIRTLLEIKLAPAKALNGAKNGKRSG